MRYQTLFFVFVLSSTPAFGGSAPVKQHTWTLPVAPGQSLRIKLPVQDCTIVSTPGTKLKVVWRLWDESGSAVPATTARKLMISVTVDRHVVLVQGLDDANLASSNTMWEGITQGLDDMAKLPNTVRTWISKDTHSDVSGTALPTTIHASVTIYTPDRLPVNAQLGVGNFSFENPQATTPITVHDGVGAVDITSDSRTIDASTGTGVLRVHQYAGAQTTLETGSGPVYWTGSTQLLRVRSGVGNIELRASPLPANADLYAQTGTGNISVCFSHKQALNASIITGLKEPDVQYPVTPIKITGHDYQFGPQRSAARVRLKNGTGNVALRLCP